MIIVTKQYRGSIVESFHIGYAVAIDDNNNIVFAAGDPEYPVYIRSAAKPFQVVPLLESGAVDAYNLSDEEIAVMCASHNGETFHVEAVSSILKKIGLGIEDLKCGIHNPLDKVSYEQMILKGRRATAVHNNCSGKHAGMLALAKHLGVSTNNYLDINHPVQEKILEKIKLYSEKDKIPFALDGCSAPTFFLPLKNIAIMFRALAGGEDEFMQKVLHIMSLHPKLIGGRGRFDTDFITLMSGRGISKVGAEGIRGIGIRTEEDRYIGIALKVLSGSWKASDSMIVEILNHLKLIDTDTVAKLQNYHSPNLLNHNDLVEGKIETEIISEG